MTLLISSVVGEDNRLTDHFVRNAILPALDHVELAWRNSVRDAKARKDTEGGKGALVITGKRSQEKFFSNGEYTSNPWMVSKHLPKGFDYPQVLKNSGFMTSKQHIYVVF